MFDFAQFHIVGRVGKVKPFEKMTRVSIAVNSSYKEKGEWVDRADWNEVVIFDSPTCKFVEQNVKPGDVVRCEGRLRQSKYERNGETTYTTELIVESFHRQPKKKAATDEAKKEAA